MTISCNPKRFALVWSRFVECITLMLFAVICNILSIPQACSQDNVTTSFSKYVDNKGNISLPDDFETSFVHLGSIAVASKKGVSADQLHVTYTRLDDLKAFQRDGKFPDGAILVKDVRATKGEELTTGDVRYAAEVKVRFVMVKDVQGRFKNSELWGDGWGWALFKGDDRKTQVAVNYRTECRTCHVPVKKQDWIYTQCYPLLSEKSVKPKKDGASLETEPKPDLAARFPQWKNALQLKGNADNGRKYFESKTLNTSLTCASCHSFESRDTMRVDGDGLMRAGFPIYAAAHRTNIKRSGTNLAALGANVCVVHFMKAPEPGMTSQELADMDRFLHSGGDAQHETAQNVDYAHLKWTIPETLTGGDAKKGASLVLRSCIACHAVGDQPAKLVEAGGVLEEGSHKTSSLKHLALRIRNPEFKINDEMPGYSDLRLSNTELIDILAWLTTK
ncbi:MAG: cytochrome c, class [Planctomycetaceae bacterium]|nr:cytochrome c, class [Planctomycetaceae bacterium]